MNYGFWLLMGQSAQTSVMAAQMRQLGGIQDELTLQRLAQQYQSILAQVLFETEQSAQQITALASHDGFAAGIHARLRLNALQGIHPGLFDRYETKRAWAAATEQLNSLWSVVDGDPQWSAFGRQTIRAIETLRQWQAFLGDPQARLAAATAAAKNAESTAKLWKTMIAGTFAGGLALMAIGGGTKTDWLLALGLLLMLFGPIVTLIGWLSRRGTAKRTKKDLATVNEHLGQLNAFLADPGGGQLLDQVAAQHPALTA